jgi:diguanylate cyclase (GGDEF)-like protein
LKDAVFKKQGPMSQNLGHAGELLTARIRLFIVAVLSITPLINTVVSPNKIENWVGLSITLATLAATYSVIRLAAREWPPAWLPWTTSQFDIFVVNLADVAFIAAGAPIVATNSFVHWSYFLLAIGATCLRYNARLTVAATLSAMLQYLATTLYVGLTYPGLEAKDYGTFDWSTQAGKLVTMLLMGLLSLAIVARNRQTWERSVRDKLTGLHNRRFFDEFLEYKCEEAARSKRAFCLALIDVDHFKRINDTLGHEAGDRVLENLGRLIGGNFRSSDLSARWGGEEFALILSDCELPEAVERLEAFRTEVGRTAAIPTTISVGVVCCPADGAAKQDLMAAADERLYAAKRSGRDRVVAGSLAGTAS